MTNYVVYDVFTQKPFGGNQLAVFPDAGEIPEKLLQSIASEFNFSEVTFVYPPEDSTNTAKVRIFTPTMEIPFAGHPIIGTVTALSDLGISAPMVLELGVGPLSCTYDASGAGFTTEVPLEIFSTPDPAFVARSIGLSAADINETTHVPTQAGLGLPFVIVELKSREALANCFPDTIVFREGAERYPAGLDFAVFAYTREGSQISSRMFAPLDNIPEDPATGSASAALSALLTKKLGGPQKFELTQGEDMGRTSNISATTTHNPVSVTIKGYAVKTMNGTFVL